MRENESLGLLQYYERVFEYAQKIINEKDYSTLARILENYDKAIRKQRNMWQQPNFPFWDVGFLGKDSEN